MMIFFGSVQISIPGPSALQVGTLSNWATVPLLRIYVDIWKMYLWETSKKQKKLNLIYTLSDFLF